MSHRESSTLPSASPVGLDAVLDALGYGVVVLDREDRLVHANAAAPALLGVDRDSDVAGAAWWRPLSSRTGGGDSGTELGTTVMETGHGVRDVVVNVARADGAVASLSVSYLPLRDGTGPVRGLVLAFRELADPGSEPPGPLVTAARMREAHEVARMTTWEWDPESDRITTLNARHRDPPSGAEATLAELLAPMSSADGVEARENLAGFVRGEYDESVRLHRRVLRGREAWLETRSKAVRDADGRLLCVRGTSQDVTEQEVSRREVAAARDLFQATLDAFPAHVAVLDQDGEILTTNRAWKAFAAIYGSPSLESSGNYFAACDAAGPDEWALRVGRGVRSVAAGEQEHFSTEYPFPVEEVERWFMLRALRYEGPGTARLVVSHEDVTERHVAEQQIHAQAELLDEVNVSVIATDMERTVTHWNRGAEALYGWTSEEAVGRDVGGLVVPSASRSYEHVRAAMDAVGHWEGQFVLARKDGSEFPAEVRNRVIVDDAGRPARIIGVSVDVSERLAGERALVEARDYMRAVADCMGQGLLTLDVQGAISYVNPAAEALLGWSEDELSGRRMFSLTPGAGGVVVTSEQEPIRRAEREGVRVHVDDAHFLRADGAELPVAYTVAPFETATGVQGCVVLFEDISERKAYEDGLRRDVEKLVWIGRIQDALAEDRFVLHAQPIVDVKTMAVVQRELLLRLREPDGRITGPGEFLPVAEKYGLIGEIDRWVVGQAAAIAATGCPVELNVSARSVGDPSILTHIRHCLEEAGADPGLLVFEITETALVEDEAAALAFADGIHALGSRLALDDFGTGYGTFTYLKQMPVDYLKIDIEFVRDLATNSASHHVVEAVVALARAFGLQTVAEGVEDGATLELLGALGVDFAQGYFIGRPTPLEPIERPDGELRP